MRFESFMVNESHSHQGGEGEGKGIGWKGRWDFLERSQRGQHLYHSWDAIADERLRRKIWKRSVKAAGSGKGDGHRSSTVCTFAECWLAALPALIRSSEGDDHKKGSRYHRSHIGLK